jgi:hypothetical protein
MKKLILYVALLSFTKSSSAQVTWSADIANIIYNNCSSCHNVNGIADFELMSYQDAVQNASDIKDEVIDRHMPPWPPDPNFSDLAHPRILTQQQIDDIESWVDNGMMRGDSTLEPAPPVISNNSEIVNPDLILNAPVYPVNTTNDLYQCFVVPTSLATDHFITGIEVIPGNRNIVHHILIYSDTSNLPLLFDAADPGPGYTNFGGTGSIYSKLIGVWVPGQGAYFSPTGMGIRLPANTNVIMQIHYPGGITGETDSSKIKLKLTPTLQREINIESPLNHYQLDNGPLFIPANSTETFYAHYTIPQDVSTLGVGPHMHLIGTSIKSWGITPSNDTIPFIDIPEWDFHWQGVYSFPKILKVPMGTVIYSEAYYDNTSNNPENPNDPPQDVSLGESTTDEMMLIYFAYTDYIPGDENIIIDSSFYTNVVDYKSTIVSTLQLYDLSPNPAEENITFQYYLPGKSNVKISILDVQGKLVKEFNSYGSGSGLLTKQLSIDEIPSGIYFLTLESDGMVRNKKFVKN